MTTTRTTIATAAAALSALVQRLAAAPDPRDAGNVSFTAEISLPNEAVITLTTHVMDYDHGVPAFAVPIAGLTMKMPNEKDPDGYRPATPEEVQRLYATLQGAGYPIGPVPEIGGHHVVYAPIVVHAAGNA